MAEIRVEATHLGDSRDHWGWYEVDVSVGRWWRWEVGTPWMVWATQQTENLWVWDRWSGSA